MRSLITAMVGLLAAVLFPAVLAADDFERYTLPFLSQAGETEHTVELKKLTMEEVTRWKPIFKDQQGAFLIVKSNQGHWGKLLVQFARQRHEDTSVPIALLERCISYKPGQERLILAQAASVRLFDGFHFSLDSCQVVPAELKGDFKYVADEQDGYLEPVGKAKMFLVTKPMPGTEAKKADRPSIGDAFEARFINGTYQLHDDGRRIAKLHLKVDEEGGLTGDYISEATGQRYEVVGKVLEPKHHLQFEVKFPQSVQQFKGWIFTRDAASICGVTTVQGREFGFYANRVDE